jgi:hypothetical protein
MILSLPAESVFQPEGLEESPTKGRAFFALSHKL